MPTRRPDKGGRWLARVMLNGRQVSKMFPPGKRGGPQWRAAKQWEEETKKNGLLTRKIRSDFDMFGQWLRDYLDYSRRKDSKRTVSEKRMVLIDFSSYCYKNGIMAITAITPRVVQQFLNGIYDARGGHVANRYLKNLKTAWSWGAKGMVDGFPEMTPPFRKEHRFDVQEKPRYVPPAEDVVKVIEHTTGQDRVMMLLFYYTGARAGEVFRLKWDDVDFQAGTIRLTDHKGGVGKKSRSRTIQMHADLVAGLRWWFEHRPCKVDNIFMQMQNDAKRGEPFTHRSHFLPHLCKKLGIKPFGFHSLRHKSAAITFEKAGLNAAQKLMGHYRATTTDRYVASAGLYTGQDDIVEALGKSEIGQAVGSLLEKEIPQVPVTPEGFCNPERVTQALQ